MSRREPHVFSAPNDGAKVFWKSLEDKANPEAAQKRAESEFALGLDEAKASSVASTLVKLRRGKDQPSADASEASVGRRGFMFFAGASAALFAEGCARRPVEKILPYAKAPEHVVPGTTSYYASVIRSRGESIGILVESHEGRPTKIEGNPDHGASAGATDAFTQAAVYEMYDPDRLTTPMRGSRQGTGVVTQQPATIADFDVAFAEIVRAATNDQGAKLRVLSEPNLSPTFQRLRDAVAAKLPQAKFHVWSSVNDGNARVGSKIAFGQYTNVVPNYAQAKVVLSVDSDFLGTETGSVRASREFTSGRKLHHGPNDRMNRLYVVEPSFTVTGMNADHRLRLAAKDVESYLLALAKELSTTHKLDLGAVSGAAGKAAAPAGVSEKWLKVVAAELVATRAQNVIVVGSRQPARVHALAHALNAALGNVGHTVNYFSPADVREDDPTVSVKELADAMEAGKVGTLVVLGGNPVYDAPADLKFADRLGKVGQAIHVSTHLNETSERCTWVIPRSHELESWGDARAIDGTVAIQQPLIAPLHASKSDLEVLARLSGDTAPKGLALVQTTLKGSLAAPGSFSRAWNEALKRGVAGPTGKALGVLEPRQAEIATALADAKPGAALSPQSLEVVFAPCPRILDGRYANNPLLLELPDPITKVTWDNVALVSPGTAKALGVENGTVVRLTRAGAGAVDIAMWITPGTADNSVTVHLGWGRTKAGRYGNKHGFDVSALRTSDAPWITSGVQAAVLSAGELDQTRDRYRKVGMAAGESPMPARIRPDDPFDADTWRYKISQTQEHDTMEGRPVAIDATLAEYKKQNDFPQWPNDVRKDRDQTGKEIPVRESGSPDPATLPLWNKVDYSKGHKWGMSVDLTSCTGCNACVVACQVENNVPAVGKEQVWRGREMHWLRIDRYFVGLDENNPQVVFQPVACVQCEEAPCENVCPVNATEHSPEGLNDMAYNRCIGTRYCANNCPYKVRRFNFLNYHTSGGFYDDVPETEKMRMNPNVTVRMRGVMEKCSYCVQRIQEAKIKSKRTGKPMKDGDVVVACQQACASDCIQFGDLNDPTSRVAKARAADRSYRLLAELGTHPRTTYLGKIRNPNPDMGEA